MCSSFRSCTHFRGVTTEERSREHSQHIIMSSECLRAASNTFHAESPRSFTALELGLSYLLAKNKPSRHRPGPRESVAAGCLQSLAPRVRLGGGLGCDAGTVAARSCPYGTIRSDHKLETPGRQHRVLDTCIQRGLVRDTDPRSIDREDQKTLGNKDMLSVKADLKRLGDDGGDSVSISGLVWET